MRSFYPVPPLFIELPVLGCEKVEQQAIVQSPVDGVTLPLPANETAVEALHDPQRRVVVYDPRIDRVKSEIPKSQTQELRQGEGRIPTILNGFVAGHDPVSGSSKGAIDAVQPNDPDGHVVPTRRIYPQKMRFPLRHDLEKGGRGNLSSVPKIEPLVILLLPEPAGGELDDFRRVEREELHVCDLTGILPENWGLADVDEITFFGSGSTSMKHAGVY